MVAAFLLLLLALPARADTITVASKIDTEGALLGQLIAQTLEHDGLTIERKIQLGPTEIVRRALLGGQIDLYPEYTGNGAFFFHQESDPVWRDAASGYQRIKALDQANHLVWLTPAPADNTWAIAVSRTLRQALPAPSLAGLAHYLAAGGTIRLAASVEFADNPGALPAFEAAYRFHLTGAQLLVLAGGDTAATIRAAAQGISGVNAAMAYNTDGALDALGVTTLADPLHTQPVYAPAPVVRAEVLQRHPELAPVLERLFATLSLETLRRLNARIAVDGLDAGTVATDYLHQAGLDR